MSGVRKGIEGGREEKIGERWLEGLEGLEGLR